MLTRSNRDGGGSADNASGLCALLSHTKFDPQRQFAPFFFSLSCTVWLGTVRPTVSHLYNYPNSPCTGRQTMRSFACICIDIKPNSINGQAYWISMGILWPPIQRVGPQRLIILYQTTISLPTSFTIWAANFCVK